MPRSPVLGTRVLALEGRVARWSVVRDGAVYTANPPFLVGFFFLIEFLILAQPLRWGVEITAVTQLLIDRYPDVLSNSSCYLPDSCFKSIGVWNRGASPCGVLVSSWWGYLHSFGWLMKDYGGEFCDSLGLLLSRKRLDPLVLCWKSRTFY